MQVIRSLFGAVSRHPMILRLLGALVPLMLELMIEASPAEQQGFGPVAYPWLPELAGSTG